MSVSADGAPASEAKKPRRQPPNCLSWLFFWWVGAIIRSSRERGIEEEDLYDIPDDCEVHKLTKRFDEHWRPEGARAEELMDYRLLLRALTRILSRRFAVAGLLMFLQNLTQLAVTVLMKYFMEWFADLSRPGWEGWVFGGCIILAQVTGNLIISTHAILQLYIVGMDARSLVNALVFRKAMCLSQKARSQTTTGQIVSLMSADSERLPMALLCLHSLWISPLFVVIGLGLLVWAIGWAAVVAVVLLLASIPVTPKIGVYQGRIMAVLMGHTDARVKAVNEGLQGIKVLKYYAWDTPFTAHVQKLRKLELRQIRRQAWAQAMANAVVAATPLLMGLCMITAYFLIDPENFTPANAFTGLSLLNLIRMPLTMIPMGMKGAVDLKSTLTRLQKYLLLEEKPTTTPSRTPQKLMSGQIVISDGFFEWEQGTPIDLSGKGEGKGKAKGPEGAAACKGPGAARPAQEGAREGGLYVADAVGFALRGVSVAAEAGQLIAVVGAVGSGKSSLLHAVLLEMPHRSGKVHVEGSVAYCSQLPWIMNATLRENILFGLPMDEDRYDEVLGMCALEPDCESLAGGDLTEIGEKGVTLSGGQKARVSLARACYRGAAVYLLDDVLSAVDSETGAWLFENCIQGLLAEGSLVVLATNNVHFLERVDAVWVLEGGTVAEQGSYRCLRAVHNGALNRLLSGTGALGGGARPALQRSDSERRTGSARRWRPPTPKAANRTLEMRRRFSIRSSSSLSRGSLVSAEARGTGTVAWQVWYYYFVTCPGGWHVALGILLIVLMSQGIKNVFEWWLSHWTADTLENGTAEVDYHLLVYALLGIGSIALQMARAVGLAEMILSNGKRLHEFLLEGVMRAPMSFFDTTPMGRILNRFSKDMDNMDNRLQQCLPNFVNLSSDVFGLVLTIAINMPIFFAPLVPLAAFYWDVSRRFRPLSRDLQRLESVSRSPLFAQFSETLSGIQTIRAYGDARRFLEQNVGHIDKSNRAFFTIHNTNRWLQIRLEFLGCCLLLAVIAFGLEGRSSGRVTAGVVGLSMYYALSASGMLNFTIRMMTETEARMTSAERIHEYATEVEPEAPLITECLPPKVWPSAGRVEFVDVAMQYRPGLPRVLDGISVVIEGGMKVGICGRTGCGKSTLLAVLFRLVDIASPDGRGEGQILIDGVDIAKLGLRDLRRGLAIIPQDAVMFAGTVRENLDLFSERTEDQLWAALRHASLEATVQNLPGCLDANVSEGGENFSCGERQLVCLARALLRQSRIICMDEATANIDVRTDATIQEVIKTQFVDRTVLTIAHRLNTIANSDRILFLESGRVAEFDTPAALLALGKAGKFHALVRELGEAGAAELKRDMLRNEARAGRAPAGTGTTTLCSLGLLAQTVCSQPPPVRLQDISLSVPCQGASA